MDKLDKLLKKIYTVEKHKTRIPNHTKEKIDNTLKMLPKNRKNTFNLKLVSISVLILISMNIVVFANEDLRNSIFNIFNYNGFNEKGLQTAVENGYIQNTDMEYIECNNTKFKIDYVSMDDSTLALNFNFLLDVDATGYEGLSFYDMKIYDDNNALIYTEEERYPNGGLTFGIGISKVIGIEGNNVIQSFLLESDCFPKTKTLKVEFSKIILYKVDNGNATTKEIDGNFSILLKLEEKFYNRKTMTYTINEFSKSDSNNLIVNKAFLTDTSLNIIMGNNEMQCFDIEIKDEYGNIIYENQNLYPYTTNDDTNQKVLRIDISKYENFSKNIKVKLNGKKIVTNSEKNIYLFNNDSTTHNIKEIETNNNQISYENIATNEYYLLVENK